MIANTSAASATTWQERDSQNRFPQMLHYAGAAGTPCPRRTTRVYTRRGAAGRYTSSLLRAGRSASSGTYTRAASGTGRTA